ncbi:LysR family transcriptional regulator [Prauserella halophila]|uniref:LysR family transcriptional regulator n=1 Tax=Prauserella halophila TaxID=185641 RepID=A0ABN1WFB2_9PSEU
MSTISWVSTLDLRLVRIFNLIYETKSLTSTAEALSVSQPAVSYALAQLRKQLADPLFIRNPEGMIPTARAAELFEVFKRSVNEIDLVVDSVTSFDPATSRRNFRLCLSDLGELTFLPALVDQLMSEAPGVALEVVPMQVDRVPEWLERGEIDAAIASVEFPGKARRNIISAERYVCVLPERLAGAGPTMTIEEFSELRHVVIDQSTGHYQVDAALRAMGVERKVNLRVHHFAVLPGVLANSDLAVIVPSQVATLFGRLWPVVVKELPFEISSFDVNLYWQDTPTRSTALSWFLDVLTRAVAGSQGRPT